MAFGSDQGRKRIIVSLTHSVRCDAARANILLLLLNAAHLMRREAEPSFLLRAVIFAMRESVRL